MLGLFGRCYMKCLLTDDNKVNCIVGSRILENMGHTVMTANNGLEAVEAVSGSRFDLVFMDCQMPVMDGYAATREIRKLPRSHPNHNIPVIALTGHASEGDHINCILCGMNARLSKPVDINELEDLLKRLNPQLERRLTLYLQSHGSVEAAM